MFPLKDVVEDRPLNNMIKHLCDRTYIIRAKPCRTKLFVFIFMDQWVKVIQKAK